MGILGKEILSVGFWIREVGQALDRVGLQHMYPLTHILYLQRSCPGFAFSNSVIIFNALVSMLHIMASNYCSFFPY